VRDHQVNMKPEVVVFLVANLLSFRNLALSANIAAGSPLSDERGAAADSAGAAKIPRPAGTQFEARRKRSLPADDVKYRTASDARRSRDLPTSASDERLTEPNIADVGDSDRRWDSEDSELIFPRYMTWIKRRSPETSGSSSVEVFPPPSDRRVGWSEAGMEWIKRRGNNGEEVEETAPVKRRWEKSGFSWMKRRCRQRQCSRPASNVSKKNLDEHGDANNWDSGEQQHHPADQHWPGWTKKDRVQKNRNGT